MSNEDVGDTIAAEVNAASVVRQWPFVLKLEHPIQFGTENITELTFQRGKVGDMKGIELRKTLPAVDLMTIASRLCGKPLKVIEMLDIDDGEEVMDIALDFFGKAVQSAGKKR